MNIEAEESCDEFADQDNDSDSVNQGSPSGVEELVVPSCNQDDDFEPQLPSSR